MAHANARRVKLTPAPAADTGRMPLIAAVVVFATSLASLLGWVLRIPRLASWIPDSGSMKPNTAAALAVAAVSLGLLARRPTGMRVRLAKALAALVVTVGVFTLLEYVFH